MTFPIWVFPKNRDTPKLMVYFMENPIKMDDLGVPLFSETSIYFSSTKTLKYLADIFFQPPGLVKSPTAWWQPGHHLKLKVNIIRNVLPIVTFVLEKLLFNSPRLVKPGHVTW